MIRSLYELEYLLVEVEAANVVVGEWSDGFGVGDLLSQKGELAP